MAVKASSTGSKTLAVLDAVARNQPIGVSELSRLLGEDKSMVQRMLVTLSDDGWIRQAASRTTKWQVTDRLRVLADIACSSANFREAAREVIARLRDVTGETVSLVVRDGRRFIVTDVAESNEMLRVAPKIGDDVPGPVSACSLSVLPYVSSEERELILGKQCEEDLAKEIEAVGRSGFSVMERERRGGTVNIASAIFNSLGNPLAVVVLSAPVGRLGRREREAAGAMIRDGARSVSAR